MQHRRYFIQAHFVHHADIDALHAAVDTIPRNINAMTAPLDESFNAIKDALSIRALAAELDARIKDTFLTSDPALVAYTGTEIEGLLAGLSRRLTQLPDNRLAGEYHERGRNGRG